MYFTVRSNTPDAVVVRRRPLFRLAFGLLVVILSAIPALAQTASVSGQVTDPSGAVVRGRR